VAGIASDTFAMVLTAAPDVDIEGILVRVASIHRAPALGR
jgi:hypothetical protein